MRDWWRAHVAVRPSTIVLSAVFLLALAAYFLLRPPPGSGADTPARQQPNLAPTITHRSTAPRPTHTPTPTTPSGTPSPSTSSPAPPSPTPTSGTGSAPTSPSPPSSGTTSSLAPG